MLSFYQRLEVGKLMSELKSLTTSSILRESDNSLYMCVCVCLCDSDSNQTIKSVLKKTFIQFFRADNLGQVRQWAKSLLKTVLKRRSF